MRYDHVQEIIQEYCYQDFASQPEHFRFIRWLYTRVWWSEERLTVLFDPAMAHLIDRKVLLPGVSALERAVSVCANMRSRASGSDFHRFRRRHNGRCWKRYRWFPCAATACSGAIVRPCAQ